MADYQAFPGPFAYLDLTPEQTINIVPTTFNYGTYTFNTKDRGIKTVGGIRVWLNQTVGPTLQKPLDYLMQVVIAGKVYEVMKHYHGMQYIDVGAQKLVAQLKPLLEGFVPNGMIFTIQAHGKAPFTHYSLEVAIIPG